jgi:hypothetical protein
MSKHGEPIDPRASRAKDRPGKPEHTEDVLRVLERDEATGHYKYIGPSTYIALATLPLQYPDNVWQDDAGEVWVDGEAVERKLAYLRAIRQWAEDYATWLGSLGGGTRGDFSHAPQFRGPKPDRPDGA